MPYSLGGEVKIDNTQLRKYAKPIIDAGVDAALAKIVGGLRAAGLGGAYDANIEAPQDIPLDPTTGLKIPAGSKVKDFVDQTLKTQFTEKGYTDAETTAATAAKAAKFQEGIGDIEIGAKYAISTVNSPVIDGIPLYLSAAAGLRLNTGDYTEIIKDGKRAVVSRGTTDLGIRLNADYELIDGLQLQVENQTELMLAKGKTYLSGKEVTYARDGARQVGYSRLMVAPGAWLDAANFVLLNARYNWDNEAATKTDGVANVGSASIGRSAQFGLGFDGLKLKLPVQLDYDYLVAARGRNVAVAADAHIVTLKLFYKF